MNLIDAIDWAVDRGWAVFPNHNGSKAPATPHGFKDATTDYDQIIAWLKSGKTATWSVRTGTEDASTGRYLVVVDVDDPDAVANLPGELPDTFEVRTGKGMHYWYLADEPIRGHVPTQGIDVKGVGGYVLLPGSLHPSGAVYEALNDPLNLHTAPEWLYTTATERRTYDIAEPVLAGERRNFLVSEAGRLRNVINDEATLAAALHALNESRCVPPFTADEYDIDRLAHDFMQRDGRNAGVVPITLADGTVLGDGEPEGDEHDVDPYANEPEPEQEYVLHQIGQFTVIEDPAETRRQMARQISAVRAAELIRQAARQRDEDAWDEPEMPVLLADEPEVDAPEFLVEDLHIVGTNTLLSARYKSGKTTLIDNLARAYADGDEFLGKAVRPHAGRLGLLDYEMTKRQHLDWLNRQGIKHRDRISLLSVRDHPSGFPLWTPKVQRYAERWIEDLEIEVLVLDTLTAAVSGWPGAQEPMNSNEVATEFWKVVNRLKEASGLKDVIIVSQYGRAAESGSERTLGATQWDAGCDNRWLLNIEGKTGDSPRSFYAHGRDVEMEKVQLAWDRDTNRLTVSGTVAEVRERIKLSDASARVLSALSAGPLNTRSLREATKLDGGAFKAIIESLSLDGIIEATQGPNRQTIYTLADPDVAMVLS